MVTTPAAASFTYTTSSCSSLPNPFATYDKHSVPSTWTRKQYNATATSNIATLVFRVQNSFQKDFHIDNVSVVSLNNPSMSLIVNGNFEQSSTVGWDRYDCSSSCNPAGSIINLGMCLVNRCYLIDSTCLQYQILQQSFHANAGQQYTVSFYLCAPGSKGGTFDASIALV